MSIHRELIYYSATQIFGALINLSIFFILIKFHPDFRSTPLIPLAFGAAASLIFNYLVSKNFIFNKVIKNGKN
jgi:putative flippase GtrA